MRPVVIEKTGAGATDPVPMNQYTSPFNVGFGCDVTGSATYTVQHTFDNVFASDFTPSAAKWYNHSTVSGVSTDQDGNYAFPVSAIRLVLSGGSTGSVKMTILQAGIGA